MTFPRSYNLDAALQLHNNGQQTVTGAGVVDGGAKIVDLGSETANFSGVLLVNIDDIEIGDGDENYAFALQASNEPDLSGERVVVARAEFGSSATMGGTNQNTEPGRYEIPFFNSLNGKPYRYLRLEVTVTGTVDTGIDYFARIGLANAHVR